MVHHHPVRPTRSSSANLDAAAADTPKRGTRSAVGRSSSSPRFHEDHYKRGQTSLHNDVRSTKPESTHLTPVVHYREPRRYVSPAHASDLPSPLTSLPRLSRAAMPPTVPATPVITPTASDTSHPSNTSTIKTQKRYTRSYDWTDGRKEGATPRPPSPESTVLTGPAQYQAPPTVPIEHPPLPIEPPIVEEDVNVNVIRSDIIHIRVGTSTTVTHSRRKLRRSSPYLSKLLSDQRTEMLQLERCNARDWHTLIEQFVLCTRFRKYSASEWCKQSSTILPEFLPWFVLLELQDCLKVADAALEMVHKKLPIVQSHKDAMDRLKICAIAKTAHLERTMEAAFASTAKQFMKNRGCFLEKTTRETSLLWTISKLLVGCLQPLDDDEDDEDEASACSGERTADEILEAIQHCDFFVPKSASLLCRAVFEFIPEECLMDHLWAANRSQLLRLLQNPLFPHLLRAGIIDDEPSSTTGAPQTFTFRLWEDDVTSNRNCPTEWLERIWSHLQKPPKLVAISSPAIPKREQYPPRRFQC